MAVWLDRWMAGPRSLSNAIRTLLVGSCAQDGRMAGWLDGWMAGWMVEAWRLRLKPGGSD